ncbi:hypothetical protein JHK87_045552 [Glycine soja]|nr:hypothetical protein JHK87_045552 [Glycine soja]
MGAWGLGENYGFSIGGEFDIWKGSLLRACYVLCLSLWKENGAQELGFDFVCLYFAAGVTPFVVAGIEFSKIIDMFQIVQKRCEVCGGSGLVLREKEKDYLRCPECGIGSCLRVLIEDPVPANSLESALSSFSPSLLCQKASFQPGGHKPMLSSFSPESPLIT